MSTSKRINRTDGEWEELIKEFNASGLTQGVFCEQRGVAKQGGLRAAFFPYGRGSNSCIVAIQGVAVE